MILLSIVIEYVNMAKLWPNYGETDARELSLLKGK